MAQGGLKKKSAKFVLPSKTKPKGKPSSSGKPLGPRKGAHFIAPKKAKLVKAVKIKKNLQKTIGQKIEQELVTVASEKGNNFSLVNTTGSGTSKQKRKKSKK